MRKPKEVLERPAGFDLSYRWRINNPNKCPYCGSEYKTHTRLGYGCFNTKCNGE